MSVNPQAPPVVVGCKACGQAIVFLTTSKGKQIPVNADSHNGSDHFFDRSRHVAHFSNCTNPERFRKRDQPKEEVR